MKKKRLYDMIFVVLATLVLSLLIELDKIETHMAFALIPILMAYFIGQWVERKTNRNEF